MARPVFQIGASTYKDIKALRKALQRGEKVFPEKWKKALDDAGDIAQKFLSHQFDKEGKEFGTPWRPLALSTQKDRARKGYKPEHPILVRRGWLRASIIHKRSAHHKRVITNTGIIMTSGVKTKSGLNLFELHQEGTRKIPARRMIKTGGPLFISERGWREIKTRFLGMFYEIRREMEK